MADLNNITFACEEPVRLAEFWREALGYRHMDVPAEIQKAVDEEIAAGTLDPTGWAMLVHPDGTGPRLLALSARVVEERSHKIGPYEEFWTVMKDPEGNGFCVS